SPPAAREAHLPPTPDGGRDNPRPPPVPGGGPPAARAPRPPTERADRPKPGSWAHAGLGVKDGLAALAALGLPMGVVSNSDGSVQGDLRRVGLCYVPDGPGHWAEGVQMGVIIDSTVVGVAKPDPGIFRLALDAMGVPAGPDVLH